MLASGRSRTEARAGLAVFAMAQTLVIITLSAVALSALVTG